MLENLSIFVFLISPLLIEIKSKSKVIDIAVLSSLHILFLENSWLVSDETCKQVTMQQRSSWFQEGQSPFKSPNPEFQVRWRPQQMHYSWG